MQSLCQFCHKNMPFACRLSHSAHCIPAETQQIQRFHLPVFWLRIFCCAMMARHLAKKKDNPSSLKLTEEVCKLTCGSTAWLSHHISSCHSCSCKYAKTVNCSEPLLCFKSTYTSCMDSRLQSIFEIDRGLENVAYYMMCTS